MEMLYVPAWMKVLYCMGTTSSNMSEIQRNVGITNSHIIKIKNEFVAAGFITFTKSGRSGIIQLTEKGQKIHYGIKTILETTPMDMRIKKAARVLNTVKVENAEIPTDTD